MDKISVRQICFVFIAFSTSIKVVFAAAVTAKYSGHALWASLLLNFIFDGVMIFSAIKISEMFPGKTFFDILTDGIGESAAKILVFIFGLAFLLKAYVPIQEQKVFVEKSLYETYPKIVTFMPYFLFCAYFAYTGIKGIARSSDIIVWFTLISVPAMIMLALPKADFSELLPILKGVPIKKIGEGGMRSGIWFFDGLYAYMFIGRFKKERLQKTKIVGAYAFSAFLVVGFAIALYAEYSSLTQRQYFAPVKIGLLSVALLNIGRVDYIAALIVTVSNVFASALPIVFSSTCFNEVFKPKNKAVIPGIISAVAFITVLATKDLFPKIFEFFQSYYAITMSAVTFVVTTPIVFCLKNRVKK